MVCRLCGSKNLDEARFCDQCAAPLARSCPSCGEINRPSTKFCSACSAILDTSAAEIPPRPRTSSSADESSAATIDQAERRRLTVLFCDLVGSTELAAKLDPEDWGQIVTDYHNRATATVERFGGHVALYLGDGILAFFGYPQAHEDDPQRAVLAGLALVSTVEELSAESSRLRGWKLAPRVGIHSGPVVVAGSSSRRANVFGSVPNIASRVEASAAPNTVIITDAVHQLVAGVFAVEDLGTRPLKGVEQPLQLYRILRPSGLRGRLALSGSDLTPFIGREDELRLLGDCWDRTREGAGQMIMITGEPGIGKSRLLRSFRDQIASIPHIWVECAGAALHQNTPFYAIEDAFRQSLGVNRQTPSERLTFYEASVELAGLDLAEAMPLLAPLMDLAETSTSKYPPPKLEHEQLRKRLLTTLTAWALGTAKVQPLVMACEDLHWSDPSTLELIQFLAEQGASAPLLLICTGRPEFYPAWPSRSHHTELRLSRLSSGNTLEMVKRVATLPIAAADAIAERSGGVPLFVEELARSVIDGGAEAATQGIPATLHDSLMARLDRLGEAREVAQVASVIGHEFSWTMLRAVSDMTEEKLASSLNALGDAQLLVERGERSEASYIFRHALIGDTAYQSLLRSKRQHYHQRIAEFLAQSPAYAVVARPQLLAHHYTEAGLIELAIPHWQMAGQLAVQRSANAEAISHLSKGLALLETLPRTPATVHQELALRISLGVPLMHTKGFTSPEVETVYGRARELCQQAGEIPQLFPALWGLWVFYTARAEHKVAHELADRCLRVAQSVGDSALLLEAHHVVGLGQIADGDFVKALEHFEAVASIYNPDQHRSQAYTFGQDPAAVCLVHSGWSLWFLGYPEQAMQKCREGLAFAETLNHPYTSVFTSAFAAWVFCFCEDPKAVMDLSLQILSISSEHGFSFYTIWAVIMLGWAMTRQSQVAAGIAKMQEGLNQYRAAGGRVLLPAFLSLLAEVHSQAGQLDEAASVLTEAQKLADESGECWWQAELYRLKGELILNRPSARNLMRSAQDESEGCFRLALDVARRQQAKSLELRATISLCQLWTNQSRHHDAQRSLERILERFNEGFDSPDLRNGGLLLGEIRKTAHSHSS